MIDNWLTAARSADTYPTTEWQNNMIVSCVMEQQGGTREEAWQFLRSDVMLPSSSTPPLAKRCVQKYLSRSVDYFYSAVATTAQRVYLKTLFEKRHTGVTREATNEAETRFTIKISVTEAARLASDDTLIHDANSLEAMKDATVAVFKRFRGGSTFIKPSPYRGVKPDLVCLLGHVAVVCTKIDEYLKRVGGKVTSTVSGINPGHREPWRVMLRALDSALSQRGETRNRLRLVDGDRADRGEAPKDTVGDAETSAGGSASEGGAPAGVERSSGGSMGGLEEPSGVLPVTAGGRPAGVGLVGGSGTGLGQPSDVGLMPVGGPPPGPPSAGEWSLGQHPPPAASTSAVEWPTTPAHPPAVSTTVANNRAPTHGQTLAPPSGSAPAVAFPGAAEGPWTPSGVPHAVGTFAPAGALPLASPWAAEGDRDDATGGGRAGSGPGAGGR